MKTRAVIRGTLPCSWLRAVAVLGTLGPSALVFAQTAQGEIENRPSSVARRTCLGGINAGQRCSSDTACPGSSCVDRNVFTLSVAVHFNATAAELTAIRTMVSSASAILFDVTDGQAEIGEAVIHNNAAGATGADVRIYPATNPTWWSADTGMYRTGGSAHVSIDILQADSAPGESLAHELVHLVFDARDEYETREPGCGLSTGGASCPAPATIAAGEHACLMDQGGTGFEGQFSELCWGQGDPAHLTDVSAGNHDATNVTEQSRCRSNRSCWEQVVWSWPDTISLPPGGAPDPEAHGAVVNPTKFVVTNDTVRVVLVLDESGSMALESPSRMARLKVAAKDFVTLAETGSQVGIVSYSNDAEPVSGRTNLAISALPANRAPWINAIDGLTPTFRTNIGAGLDRALDLITTAGGVTGSTFVVLMTDGLNNEPWPNPAATLAASVASLLAAGVPVYVTCTGSDLGLASQCAEIATGTGGLYVDSTDAADLPSAFVDFNERIHGRESTYAQDGVLESLKTATVFVDKGSEFVTFALSWKLADTTTTMVATSPSGKTYRALPMPQGQYVRVKGPEAGEWILRCESKGNLASPYRLRGYVRHRSNALVVSARYPSVKPGEPIQIYAMPRARGGAISSAERPLVAEVRLPDGTRDRFVLQDLGRKVPESGDDMADDGIFAGVYRNTKLKGSYGFIVRADIDGWLQSGDRPKRDPGYRSERFHRATELSVAVGDPRDVDQKPDDPPSKRP